MSGGQHRVDEVTRTEPVSWTGHSPKIATDRAEQKAVRRNCRCVCELTKKRNQNNLDEADFVRDVDKSAYHHLSQNEIASDKACCC